MESAWASDPWDGVWLPGGLQRDGEISWGRNSSWTGIDSTLETEMNPYAKTCHHLFVFFWLVTP